MKENFSASLGFVLASEGGFTSDDRDPGNAGGKCTNLGVTQKAGEDYVGHPVSRAVMQFLTPAAVAPFYHAKYWDAAHCDFMSSGLDYMLFDFAVNAGVGRAVKTLQSAAGADPDGSIGLQTLTAIAISPDILLDFSVAKQSFYKSLPTFATFGKGWLKRVDDVLHRAQIMCDFGTTGT